MTKIYAVTGDGFEDEEYHPTRKAAERSVAWWAERAPRGDVVELVAYECADLPLRQLLAAIANQKDWAASRRVVITRKGRVKPSDEPTPWER